MKEKAIFFSIILAFLASKCEEERMKKRMEGKNLESPNWWDIEALLCHSGQSKSRSKKEIPASQNQLKLLETFRYKK